MCDWIFHKDCIHYDSIKKEPRPERGHPKRQYIKCEHCGYAMHYYTDNDFENIKTQCRFFEPVNPTIFDYINS